ncbi:hypothetical protein [Staphylococcus xylosus]|uniref:hypothetical protein n=1 Tax=Staphylococcus xylosus TaxID=1288 RepID=UPI0011CC83A4|nr:hypothetical protein [Staphylococcus xylosus]
MELFIKKYTNGNNSDINRLYLGYEKKGWNRKNFYIDISEYPSIMIAGVHENILSQIGTLIGYNINNRLFDSEMSLEIHGESLNVKNKYRDFEFEFVYDNKSVETLLLELKQEAMKRHELLDKERARDIWDYNEKAHQKLKRRVIIIDEFEEVMDNIIVLGLYKELITRMRIVGITLIATVNTDKLLQNRRPTLFRQLTDIQKEMVLYSPCKILTQTNETFDIFPYDTQQLKDRQMVVEYGKYKRDNGKLGALLSGVLQIPNVLPKERIEN